MEIEFLPTNKARNNNMSTKYSACWTSDQSEIKRPPSVFFKDLTTHFFLYRLAIFCTTPWKAQYEFRWKRLWTSQFITTQKWSKMHFVYKVLCICRYPSRKGDLWTNPTMLLPSCNHTWQWTIYPIWFVEISSVLHLVPGFEPPCLIILLVILSWFPWLSNQLPVETHEDPFKSHSNPI